MENVIDELEMITSPLAESEDSIISEMSTRNDITKSSWLEMRRIMDSEDDHPPPVPQRDYSRIRPTYRKHGDEFNFFSRPRPPRPKTPEHRRYSRNARKLVDRKREAIYAVPKTHHTIPEHSTEGIEEFVEPPRYAKRDEPAEGCKVGMVERRLETLRMVREDSLTSLLKKELEKRNRELPEYVEPKDPIIRELQEFLKIEPREKSSEEEEEESGKEKLSLKANEHRLVAKGFQKLIKTPSMTSSSTSSTLI